MVSDHFVYSDSAPDGTDVLGIVARRSYTMHDRSLTPAEPRRWLPSGDDLLAMFRATTDVVLIGSAHSCRGPVTRLCTELMVGPVAKRVDVVGDRTLKVAGDGSLAKTRPTFRNRPGAAFGSLAGDDPGLVAGSATGQSRSAPAIRRRDRGV